MSTSDAAEWRLGAVGGGETAAPLCATQTRTRTSGEEDETSASCFEQQSDSEARPSHSLITTEKDTELTHSPKRTKVLIENPRSEPKFTSHFSLKLGPRPDPNKPDNNLHKKTDSCTHSLPEPSGVCSPNIFYRVHQLTSYAVDKIPLPVRKITETQGCISIETSSGDIQSFSNGRCGLLKKNTPQSGLPPQRTDSVTLEVDHAKVKELSGHSTMLSSTVVTVLAPQWTGRMRRTKREGTGTSDFQGNMQDRTNSASIVERMLTSRFQSQQQVPFVRSNTVGWSTRSGPTILDNELQRKVRQSASLDVNSMRLDNKRTDRPIPSPLSPLSPVSPMSIDSNEPQRSPQKGHSPLSSKPTTSSMLLSLRRGSSPSPNSPRSPNEYQTQSPENLISNQQFSTYLSQAFQHKNQLSPTSISNSSNAPLLPSPIHRDRSTSATYNFSTVPSKHIESPYSQTNLTHSEALSPQRSVSREPSDSVKLTKKPVTLSKRTPYDHTALLTKHSAPSRTPLSSISWWPRDHQEGSSQMASNGNNKSSTPTTTPFSNNNNPADNRGINGQIPNYRDNKNTAESAGKGNIVVRPQGGTASVQHSPNHQSLVKGQAESCLIRETPKPMSLPGVLCTSKFSIAAPHTAMSNTKGPTNHDASSGSYTAKVTEFSPTLLSPKSSYTSSDNSSKYLNMYCASKSASSAPQNKERFTKQSHLHDITNTVTNANYKSSLNFGQSNKTCIQCSPVSHQANSSASTHTLEHSHSPKFTNSTLLGFERSYVPKPYQAKTNLNPTVSLYSKNNYSPTFTNTTPSPSSPSVLSPHSPPVIVSSLLTPPPTPSFTGSPETPSPKDERRFSGSPEIGPKKTPSKLELKKNKRVTFEDTVDSNKEEKPDPSNSLSPQNIKVPSIFKVLRPGSQPNTFFPTPKSSSIQTGAGGKYRSLSSDSADLKSRETYKQLSTENGSFDHKKHDLNMPRQERTLSAESGVQYRCSNPLSMPPDFSNSYKNRYSSPPYSTLMSSRTAQPETTTKPQHPPLFQRHSQPNVPNTLVNTTSSIAKHPRLPVSTLPLRPVLLQLDLQESVKCKDILLDQVNNNSVKSVGEVLTNGQIQLVDNRVHVSSQSLPGDRLHRVSSTCVTETLVYSIRAKTDTTIDGPKNTTPKATTNTPVSKEASVSQQGQIKEALREQNNQSIQGCNSSVESQAIVDDRTKSKIKEVGNSKFYSIESSSEQSPKRGRFARKKSSSTPNAGLTRSDSERASKMDQVLIKLKQTFSSRKPANDEDLSSKKWKKTSHAPSLSGMSDISSTSDATSESNKTLEEKEVRMELNNNEKGVEDKHKRANNRYTLVPAPAAKNTMAEDKFLMWTDEDMADTENNEQADFSENGNTPHLKIHNPIVDLNHETFDFKPASQYLSPKDVSPVYSPNSSCAFASTQFRKTPSSPRSPFSPFPSLSPVSPFSSPDVLEDNVFYSPKPPRHRDSSSSPCELGEISLVASRRSRASTGPPSAGPVTNKERMSTSYADLKYGIEPGRSFSVSSVSSSRPSGPGRISTGSRFMSVGDLTKPAFSCGHTAKDLENWSEQYGSQCSFDPHTGCFPNDGKVRSRSLPRSFTQCLSNWSSGQSSSSNNTFTNPTWGQNVDKGVSPWDTEGPPTPPPTPPMSPVTRRMSKPPCLSPPSFTGQSDPPQDNQSPRGRLRSKGFLTSLSTFEESSDSSSDTTTDDEYYLETGEDEEKETEL